jgi:hypothetical protein
VAVVWWATGIHDRVATVEATLLALAARITAIEAASCTRATSGRSEASEGCPSRSSSGAPTEGDPDTAGKV